MSPSHTVSNTNTAGPIEALKHENERLLTLCANLPEEILIVSDFHLGRGRDPVTGRFSRTENFLADETFARFLDYSKSAPNKLLLINGDAFDFVRICEHPAKDEEFEEWSSFLSQLGLVKTPAELRKSISKTEVKFGLETDDYKSVWKLLQIAKGHREFFRALAKWINHGGLLMLSKGNHDLELYWPLVRQAFKEFLRLEGAASDAIHTRVFYCDDSLRIGNVYFEHGHRYDPEQSIDDMDGSPVLPDKPDQLKLPLGIFVNRYLINQLEKLELFLGSVRPTERILWMLLRSHPLAAIGMLFRSLKFIRRAFQASKGRGLFWYAVYLGALALSLVPVLVAAGIFIFATHPKDVIRAHPWRYIIGGTGLFAPHLAAAVREIVKWVERKFPRKKTIGEDDMASGVYATMQQKIKFPAVSQVYAVMGHTHDQDVQSLPELNGAKVLYLNTGTWIPVWPEDRLDLSGQVLFPFVHFRQIGPQEYRHAYMEWRDDRGEAAESYILLPDKS